MTLTQKIKEDYGTVLRFCKLNGINNNTFRVVVAGNAKSEKIVKILKKHKYIKSASELEKKSA